MKTKIILALMIMLSMLMVSAGEEGNFTVKNTIKDVILDVTVDYDADVSKLTNGDNYYLRGNYEIEGTMGYNNEVYNTELDADGNFIVNGEDILYLNLRNIDGKLYQNSETQFLYKDKDNKYYGYLEYGYNVDGTIVYDSRDFPQGHELLNNNLNFIPYSDYIVTRSKPIGKFTLSSPSLGLGYKGSVAGDHIPELFTYRDQNTWERVVSETYPENHDGPVIITPTRIAGEPLVPNEYWETAKGQRTSEWKANHA